MKLKKELDTALKAARSAGIIQLEGLKNSLDIEVKSDQSPVTQIDKACESSIIKTIKEVFPKDGFLGEESGEVAGKSGRRWIIDPIDGTRPYIYGLPFFSTLIALEQMGECVVGVIHLPALKETCYAAKGGGAFCNRRPITVSKTKELSAAHGAVLGINEPEHPLTPRLKRCMGQAGYLFGFNDAHSYASTARGRMDFVISILDKPWDRAPISIIIKEAGGEFSDFDGGHDINSPSIVVSNGLIHEQLLQALSEQVF
jgi:histidinol phosphatase-like enzyme (inositol monophosphatase family)